MSPHMSPSVRKSLGVRPTNRFFSARTDNGIVAYYRSPHGGLFSVEAVAGPAHVVPARSVAIHQRGKVLYIQQSVTKD